MKKEKIKTIAIIVTVMLLLSILIGIMFLRPASFDVRYSRMYTLRGFLYETEDLGNNSYYFFMNGTSHQSWGGDWTFPYQEGKIRFYFSDVRDFSIPDFVDRDIHINYRSDGIESEITGIGYTYYDSILQAEKEEETEKCNLILEQRVACFQGCHAFIRLLYPDFYNQTELWRDAWKQCIKYCECRYNVTFKDDGSIDNCSYCDECD